MIEPICGQINSLVVKEAERVFFEHGMGAALRAAVKLAYAEGRRRYPERDTVIENRDIINALMAHNLVPVQL